MKKLFALLLLIIYGVTSFGMTVHFHYCCGKVDKISFSSQSFSVCDHQKIYHQKKCCNDKNYEFKLKIDQQKNSTSKILSSSSQIITLLYNYSNISFLKTNAEVTQLKAPPPRNSSPLYLYYCVYLI